MIKGIEKLRNLKILESKSFGAFKKDLKKKTKKLEKKLILSSFINMNRKKQNEKKILCIGFAYLLFKNEFISTSFPVVINFQTLIKISQTAAILLMVMRF